MAVPLMPQINRTEIDGVPTMWSPAPGPLAAGLVFRVGRADERPVEGGITHLVEHLAMVPLGRPRYDHNAFVDSNRTVFFAAGTPEEVSAFFDVVSRSLGALPLGRLAKERDILRREADEREGSIFDMHRHLRFGMSGHGLPGEREFGLATVQAARIEAWSRSAFTRGNAALWLTGQPPATLRLHLPDGPRLSTPPPRTIPDLQLPVHVGGMPGFGIGFTPSRETGAGTFMSILHQRLRQRLRLEDGVIYDLLGSYEPLDADWAIALFGTDCAPDQVPSIVDVGLGEIDALAGGGATEAELAEELVDLDRAHADETATAGLLDVLVHDELLGRPPESPGERYERAAGTTAADIAARAGEARSSAMLLADLPEPPPGFHSFPMSSATAVDGREIKPLLSVLGLGRRQRLTIGRDGVTLRTADGTLTTIRYEDCVMLERPAEDEIVLWDLDGDRLYLPAIFWRGGTEVLREIAAALPADIVTEEKFSADLID